MTPTDVLGPALVEAIRAIVREEQARGSVQRETTPELLTPRQASERLGKAERRYHRRVGEGWPTPAPGEQPGREPEAAKLPRAPGRSASGHGGAGRCGASPEPRRSTRTGEGEGRRPRGTHLTSDHVITEDPAMRKLDFESKRLTTYITAEQLAALEALSIETGAPITIHVRRALDAYLADRLRTPKRKKGA